MCISTSPQVSEMWPDDRRPARYVHPDLPAVTFRRLGEHGTGSWVADLGHGVHSLDVYLALMDGQAIDMTERDHDDRTRHQLEAARHLLVLLNDGHLPSDDHRGDT